MLAAITLVVEESSGLLLNSRTCFGFGSAKMLETVEATTGSMKALTAMIANKVPSIIFEYFFKFRNTSAALAKCQSFNLRRGEHLFHSFECFLFFYSQNWKAKENDKNKDRSGYMQNDISASKANQSKRRSK